MVSLLYIQNENQTNEFSLILPKVKRSIESSTWTWTSRPTSSSFYLSHPISSWRYIYYYYSQCTRIFHHSLVFALKSLTWIWALKCCILFTRREPVFSLAFYRAFYRVYYTALEFSSLNLHSLGIKALEIRSELKLPFPPRFNFLLIRSPPRSSPVDDTSSMKSTMNATKSAINLYNHAQPPSPRHYQNAQPQDLYCSDLFDLCK